MELLVAAVAADPARAASPPRSQQRSTTEQRYAVIALHKFGINNTAIARAQKLSRPTVKAIIDRYKETGSPMSGSRSGRPRATNETTDTAIAVSARVEPFTSPRRIRRVLDLDISPRTVD